MTISKYWAIFIMPAGILMGIPFPLGISIVGSSALAHIRWALAVIGCISVIAQSSLSCSLCLLDINSLC